MKANIELDLKPFMVPNFVLVKGKAIKTSGGDFIEPGKFRLQDLDPQTLAKLCENFTNNVFQKAGKQRPNE